MAVVGTENSPPVAEVETVSRLIELNDEIVTNPNEVLASVNIKLPPLAVIVTTFEVISIRDKIKFIPLAVINGSV